MFLFFKEYLFNSQKDGVRFLVYPENVAEFPKEYLFIPQKDGLDS